MEVDKALSVQAYAKHTGEPVLDTLASLAG